MKYRFLCVDDERRSLATLERICKKLNPENEVYAFDNSLDALKFAKTHPIDVALLDIDMPGLSGIKLTEELMKYYKQLNVILVTAFSEYALVAYEHNCSGYLLKPITLNALKQQLAVLRFSVGRADEKLTVQCFGNFEVFYRGKPITFHYSKTKELLAFLVDRKGAACTNGQICACLWDDDGDHNEYLKKLKNDLTSTITTYTAEEIFLVNRGSIALNKAAVSCDYYDYLNGEKQSFHGEYMETYSWAEMTKYQL